MDITEWAEQVVTVSVEQADTEGLPCAYCCGPDDLRIRARSHDACIERHARLIAEHDRDHADEPDW